MDHKVWRRVTAESGSGSHCGLSGKLERAEHTGPCSAGKCVEKRPSLVKIVNCGRKGTGNLRVRCEIEGEFCEAVVDTGASDIIINPNVLDQSIGGWDLIDRLVDIAFNWLRGLRLQYWGAGL